MAKFDTTIHRLARDLPPAYVEWAAAEYEEEIQPDEELPDIGVTVEYNHGWFKSGCRSGHPDNWTEDEGEAPEVVKVTIDEGDHDITKLFSIEQLRVLGEEAWEDQNRHPEDDRW